MSRVQKNVSVSFSLYVGADGPEDVYGRIRISWNDSSEDVYISAFNGNSVNYMDLYRAAKEIKEHFEESADASM